MRQPAAPRYARLSPSPEAGARRCANRKVRLVQILLDKIFGLCRLLLEVRAMKSEGQIVAPPQPERAESALVPGLQTSAHSMERPPKSLQKIVANLI
jgi:hypothetical protein